MPPESEKSVFLSALDRESPADREACGPNAALRQAVDQLLAAHEQSENVLVSGPDENFRGGVAVGEL